jgi:hypothetical protein
MRNPRGACFGALLTCLSAIQPTAFASDAEALVGVRPTVVWTNAPAEGDTIGFYFLFRWAGQDAEGSTLSYRIATDPAPGDTAWITVNDTSTYLKFSCTTLQQPLPASGQTVIASDAHTVVLKAVDGEGLQSMVQSRSFTTTTVAPQSLITNPAPTQQFARQVSPSVIVKWIGHDFDGLTTQYATKFKYKLVEAATIDPGSPSGTSPGQVQSYFADQAANAPTTWDSIPGQRFNYASYTGLVPGTVYYFAVMAFDEVGAHEGRFNQNSNVLRLRALNLVDVPGTTGSNSSLSLAPVVPNPVGNEATIRYTVPSSGAMQIAVFDVAGKSIRLLRSGELDQGTYTDTWNRTDDDGRLAPAGVYFVRLTSAQGTRTQRMILLSSSSW